MDYITRNQHIYSVFPTNYITGNKQIQIVSEKTNAQLEALVEATVKKIEVVDHQVYIDEISNCNILILRKIY